MDDAARFPCAQCGAALRYSPGQHRLVCEYCGHENIIDAPQDGARIEELDFRAALRDELWRSEAEETTVVRCTECGATVEFDPDIHAAQCPYCAEPLVTGTGKHRHFKPKAVLPFAINEKEASGALSRWLGSRWFAPSGLKEYARADRRMAGVYTPYWTFDADCAAAYTGQRGDVYYETVWVTVQTEQGPRRQAQQVPRIRWRPASGRVRRFFDDVLVLGSRALPKSFSDQIGRWDLHALVPYNPSYLAGFRAEAYTVDLEEGFNEARGVMDLNIRRDIRFDIGGDQQRIHNVDMSFRDVTFKHILLPLWVAAYRYKGKTYRFVVNGRTGSVAGERPYSRWKLTVAFILGAIAMLVFLYLFAQSGAADQMFGQGGGVTYQLPPYQRGY